MGDFIKELNIVDFLGMLLPGSFLILLFSMDYPIEIFFTNYFGTNIDGGVKAVLLIICGYFAGMLIHEIGDTTEKVLHYNMYLNPRFYAAKSVGYDKIIAFSKQKSYGISKLPYNKDNKNIKKIFVFSLFSVFFWYIILGFSLSVCFWNPIENNFICIISCSTIAALFCIIIMKKYEKNNKTHGDIDIHIDILNLNSEIQSLMFDKGTVTKRRVFDGFHVMMRNIIIVIAIVQAYVYLVHNKEKQLYNLISTIYSASWMKICFFIVIAIMVTRWIHYVYLKYKYLYEDYIIYCTDNNKNP